MFDFIDYLEMADFVDYLKSEVWQSNQKEAKSSGEHFFYILKPCIYLFSESTDPNQLLKG